MQVQHGDVVSTPAKRIPLTRHFGVWDAANRLIIHNTTPGGVQYARWDDFDNGDVRIEKRAAPGFEEFVVTRARELLGVDYDLVNFNCEHLANLVATGKKESPQLQRAVFGIGLAALALWSSRRPTYDAAVDRYRDRKGRFVSR